jgi:hypothetical protein
VEKIFPDLNGQLKLYMQKKRKDEKFRVEEKDKDNRARKLTREDNKIKAKERDKNQKLKREVYRTESVNL